MSTVIHTDTPSSDHRNFLYAGALAIAIGFGAFGAFATFASLDSAAQAPGRVTAETSTKPLQHLEGGIVREILVREAQEVRQGEVLLRLEPTQAKANTEIYRKQLEAAVAQEARLVAERDGASEVIIPEGLSARASDPAVARVIADERRQHAEHRKALRNEMDILSARLGQTTKQLGGAERQEKALRDQLANIGDDIANLTALQSKGLYPKSKLMALQRERSRVEGQLGATEAERARLAEVANETRLEMQQAEQKVREEAGQQLTELRPRMADLAEKLGVASDVMSRVEIRAPQSGVVQGIKVHTAGAVVKPGETIAELVPTSDKLVMAARVSPLDIDSVAPGQTAEVRFPGLSSRSYPTILGRVERVAADSMQDDVTKEAYYPAQVEIDLATVPSELVRRLRPGMPADVLINTGSRTLLQYLVGPLSDIVAGAMREQ